MVIKKDQTCFMKGKSSVLIPVLEGVEYAGRGKHYSKRRISIAYLACFELMKKPLPTHLDPFVFCGENGREIGLAKGE